MGGFYQLDRRERLRRLRALATSALAHYDLKAVEVKLIHDEPNTTYRVTQVGDGGRLLLRIHTPQRPRGHIRSELA